MQNTGKKLFRAFGDIDERYIAEAGDVKMRETKLTEAGINENGMKAVKINMHQDANTGKLIHMSRKKRIKVFKIGAAAACAALVIAAGTVWNNAGLPQTGGQGDNGTSVQIPSPFVEYRTLAEAEAVTGFTLDVPETYGTYDQRTIQVMDGSMIEVIYRNTDGEEGLRIRKERGNEDISGDYNVYSEQTTETESGKQALLRGNDGTVSSATWTDGDYSYAVSAVNHPLDAKDMTALVKAVK